MHLKRIGIVLTLEERMDWYVRGLSHATPYNSLVLGPVDAPPFPHISLFQLMVEEKYIGTLNTHFQSSGIEHAATTKFSATGRYVDANGAHIISVFRTHELIRLHERALAFNQYRTGIVSTGSRLTNAQCAAQNEFGYPYVGMLWDPQIAYAITKKPERLVRWETGVHDFFAFYIALAELGEYGTAMRILARLMIPMSIPPA